MITNIVWIEIFLFSLSHLLPKTQFLRVPLCGFVFKRILPRIEIIPVHNV